MKRILMTAAMLLAVSTPTAASAESAGIPWGRVYEVRYTFNLCTMSVGQNRVILVPCWAAGLF